MDIGPQAILDSFNEYISSKQFYIQSNKENLAHSGEFYVNKNNEVISYDGRNIKCIKFEEFESLSDNEKEIFKSTVSLVKTMQEDKLAGAASPACLDRKIAILPSIRSDYEGTRRIIRGTMPAVQPMIEGVRHNLQVVRHEIFLIEEQKYLESLPFYQHRLHLSQRLQDKLGEVKATELLKKCEKELDYAFLSNKNLQEFQRDMNEFLGSSPESLDELMSPKQYLEYAKQFTSTIGEIFPAKMMDMYTNLLDNTELEKNIASLAEDKELQNTLFFLEHYLAQIAWLKLKGFGGVSVSLCFPYSNIPVFLINAKEGVYLAGTNNVPLVFDAKKNAFLRAEIDFNDEEINPLAEQLRGVWVETHMKVTDEMKERRKQNVAIENFARHKVFIAAHLCFFAHLEPDLSPETGLAVRDKDAFPDKMAGEYKVVFQQVPNITDLVGDDEEMSSILRYSELAFQYIGSSKNIFFPHRDLPQLTRSPVLHTGGENLKLPISKTLRSLGKKHNVFYSVAWKAAHTKLVGASSGLTEQEAVNLLLQVFKEASGYFRSQSKSTPLASIRAFGGTRDELTNRAFEEHFAKLRPEAKLHPNYDDIITNKLLPKLAIYNHDVKFGFILPYLREVCALCFLYERHNIELVFAEDHPNCSSWFEEYNMLPGEDVHTVFPALRFVRGDGIPLKVAKGIYCKEFIISETS